ncbi:hypothetical protein H181DRAFT_00961 [Streptomyces sp. WMMB 714]|nr:hypothetical protein H181DRAFT_00961 [Streptomyces sp. WMMB 714]
MMPRLSRAVLLAVLPVELLLGVLLVSGVQLPAAATVAAEAVVALVLLAELAAGWREFTRARRRGEDRGAALRTTVRQLVPVQVRRILSFELKGIGALLLWAARRRNGVPPGTVAVPYAKEQFSTLLAFAFVMAVEAAGVEVLLLELDAPAGLRAVFLLLDGYSLLAVLALLAARVTRPHVVSAHELRVRSGVFVDLRIPRALISSVRTSRKYDERGMASVEDGRCAVPVASQTNVTVELTEPVTVERPLGRRARATTVRFFADAPTAAVEALRTPVTDRARP